MTRDYNKKRRDDVRPSSRNQSMGRQRDEQSPRSPRPRLNRETVDRAWESGAPTNHADYRTRSSHTQPPRNNWRNNQSSDRSSAQYGRKPFGNREENYRRIEHPSDGYSGPRSQSFDSDRRPRTHEVYRNSDGPRGNGDRPPFRDNRQQRPFEQRAPYRGNAQGRGYRQRDDERSERQPRDFGPNNRPPGSFERPTRPFDPNHRPPHSFERPTRDFSSNNRPSRSFGPNSRPPREVRRNDRPAYNAGRPDIQNPRWQSRPATQRGSSYREQPHFNRSASQPEQFEGDYERFDAPEQRGQPSGRRFRDNGSYDRSPSRAEEQPITRLPDGRVLKGPRQAQRKNAAFWTDIAQETDNLIEQVAANPADEIADQPTTETEVQEQSEASSSTQPMLEEDAPATPRRPRTRAASSVIREKKAGSKHTIPAKVKGHSGGPKPSKRGFKWPMP